MFSDHGWHLGEKQHWGKWTGWERATRVPLIIIPPLSEGSEDYNRGAVCSAPVNLIDLYPTIADLCEVSHDLKLDGQSLRPYMKNIPTDRTDSYSLSVFDRGNYSLRGKRFRYIRYKDGTEELYDMIQDPAEWDNLVSVIDHASVLDTFRKKLSDLVRRVH